ncbi:hypothetical protein ACFLV0_01325 [Chloroflexota bacterium]
MEFKKLFEPIKIGSVEIKNRIAMSPMNVHYSQNGYVTEQDICFNAARAKGGAGLIITGATLPSKRAADQQDMMIHYIYKATHVTGMADLTETIHHFGAKVFVQFSPGFGRQQRNCNTQSWAPSPIPYPLDAQKTADNYPEVLKGYAPLWVKRPPIIPREMTIDEIKQDQEDIIKAVDLALLAGFDGIHLHACHGYLIFQFLSPCTNIRTDQYGGSLENRARYLVEMVAKIRREFGSTLPIQVRLSGAEHMDGGLTEEDSREIAKMTVAAGADSIFLSDGCKENYKYLYPEKDNLHILEEQGKKLRDAAKVPIISFGIHGPELCEKAVSDGQVDMVGLGRSLLADPEWPNKVREGRIDEIVHCKRDDFCVVSVAMEGGIRCSSNPNLGRERYMPEYWPTKRMAKVPEVLRRIRYGSKE